MEEWIPLTRRSVDREGLDVLVGRRGPEEPQRLVCAAILGAVRPSRHLYRDVMYTGCPHW